MARFGFRVAFLLLILSHRGVPFPAIICPRIVRVCNVLSVHKYLKNFSSPCFNLRSKLFRTNEGEKAALLHSSFFALAPTFARKRPPTGYPGFKELINNSRKEGCFLFFRKPIKTCQETLFDWLIIQSLVWITIQDLIVHSHYHFLDRQQPARPNFLKSNLVSDLFHGYKDLAGQSS